MRYWIDIANAPHATLFAPIARELQHRGHDLVVTTWDRGQAHELATRVWPNAVPVGLGYRRPLLGKATAIWSRARGLQRAVGPLRPDVALGHNSYAQIVAARRLRIANLTMMDYEHQPANHLAFRLADLVILPEAIPFEAVKRFGVDPRRLLRYQGLKEDIALAGFAPSAGFIRDHSLPSDVPIITMRPAAVGALYHRHENPLFKALASKLAGGGAHVLISPRTTTQGNEFETIPGVRVLREAVSGPDLLYHSDLVVGAGGTMTRESAVLGTPAYSVFRGRPAAVDALLASQGRLRFVHTIDDVSLRDLPERSDRPARLDDAPVRRIVDQIIGAVSRLGQDDQLGA